MSSRPQKSRAYEWPTICLLIATYSLWVCITIYASYIGVILAIILLSPVITLHSSLQHETLHVIEPRSKLFGQLVVFPAIGLFIPYIRFRDSHLEHHKNEYLTDPYDDPESFYLVKEVWETLPKWKKKILIFNNTLAGRLLIGPLVGQIAFMSDDLRRFKAGDPVILKGWLVHIPAISFVITWLITFNTMPIWAYILSCYFGLSILKIRTYLEHRAHESSNGRSVVIEDRGILSFLFLNNNYHATHHAFPHIPWYNLPVFFNVNRERFLNRNNGYYYSNYREVFRNYFFQPKEPVEHPIWNLENRSDR